MNITSLAMKRPVTTLMVFVCCAALGAISAGLLPLEKFPEVEFPGIHVEIRVPNSAEDDRRRIVSVGLATMGSWI